MAIEKAQDRITIKHSSGAKVEVLKYGATVISWTLANGEKQLFLSDAAKLDGSKAVRGGIPLVFPVFGKSSHHPTASLPQHGFARISTWRVTGEAENSVTFELRPEDLDSVMRKLWEADFTLTYTVELDEKELKTEFQVYNPGADGFECHTLLHTYLRVPDVTKIGIEGLHGLRYHDKITGKVVDGIVANDGPEVLKITGATDRVYEATPPETKILANSKSLVTLTRDNFKDVVVWNPYVEGASSMGDFEPKTGWKNMICVEAGNVAEWQNIPPGGSWKGVQVMKAHL